MKRLVLFLLVVLALTVNFSVLSWGGVDLTQWSAFGTNDAPQEPKK